MKSSPEVGVALAPSKQIDTEEFLELAQLGDSLGYRSLWVPETWGHDAVSLLAAVAGRTDNIEIASGVLNVYSRSPALIAQTAATLQELSGGRFILGLGASGPIPVERWHGTPYGNPLTRTREAIAVIRSALSGDVVDAALGGMRLSGFRLSNPRVRPVPLFLAALGPRNSRLAGELADGWLPIFLPRTTLAELTVPLRQGAERAGRTVSAIEVAAYLPGLIGPRGEQLLRQQLAYYIGGMGTFYRKFVRGHGFASEAETISRLWGQGERHAAAGAVSDRLLDACTLGDDPARARTRITQYQQEGVDLPIISIPRGASFDDVVQTLIALCPAPEQVP